MTLWINGPTWINDEESWPKWTPNLKSEISMLTTTQDAQNTVETSFSFIHHYSDIDKEMIVLI